MQPVKDLVEFQHSHRARHLSVDAVPCAQLIFERSFSVANAA